MSSEKMVNNDMKPVLYVFVRKLESMNPGKAQAHSAHAASQMMYHFMKSPTLSKDPLFQFWIGDGAYGFGTQINLDHGDNWEALSKITLACQSFGYECGMVVDPTYPFIVEKEIVPLLNSNVTVVRETSNGKFLCTRKCETAFWAFVDVNHDAIQKEFENYALAP